MNLIGVDNGNKKKPKENTLEYLSFEANPSLEELREDVKRWLSDDSYIKDYQHIRLLRPGSAIVRLYRYEETSVLLGKEDENIKRIKILPYCKVIKTYDEQEGGITSPSTNVATGSILIGSPSLSDIVTNGTWLQWSKVMKDERPKPDIPEPPMLIGKILDWRESSMLILDHTNITSDDEFTFVRPITEFNTMITIEDLIKSL